MCYYFADFDDDATLAERVEYYNSREIPEVQPFNGDGFSWQNIDVSHDEDLELVTLRLTVNTDSHYFDHVGFDIIYFYEGDFHNSHIALLPHYDHIKLLVSNEETDESPFYRINLGVEDNKELIQEFYKVINTCFNTIKDNIDITNVPLAKDFIKSNLNSVVAKTLLQPTMKLGIDVSLDN